MIQPLTLAMIAFALAAGGAAITSHTFAGVSAAPGQAPPASQIAGMTATMPIVLPVEAIDPAATYFVEMSDRINRSSIRP
jgi:hypothetical protein